MMIKSHISVKPATVFSLHFQTPLLIFILNIQLVHLEEVCSHLPHRLEMLLTLVNRADQDQAGLVRAA